MSAIRLMVSLLGIYSGILIKRYCLQILKSPIFKIYVCGIKCSKISALPLCIASRNFMAKYICVLYLSDCLMYVCYCCFTCNTSTAYILTSLTAISWYSGSYCIYLELSIKLLVGDITNAIITTITRGNKIIKVHFHCITFRTLYNIYYAPLTLMRFWLLNFLSCFVLLCLLKRIFVVKWLLAIGFLQMCELCCSQKFCGNWSFVAYVRAMIKKWQCVTCYTLCL